MKAIKDLKDLMIEQLRDLYNAEQMLDEFLPYLFEEVDSPQLKEAIDSHLFDNKGQVMRLRQVFDEHLFEEGEGETCGAMKTMIQEARDLVKRCEDPEVRDAGIITALQHMIHYEIAGYGAVCTYAKMLDIPFIGDIVHKNLDEEKRSDRALVMMAEGFINEKAV